MSLKKVIIAVGGNVLESGSLNQTIEEQKSAAREAAKYIVDVHQQGYEIGIVHGSGPQIGKLMMMTEYSREIMPVLPLEACTSMIQGYMGYYLQDAICEEFRARGINTKAVNVPTRVEVDSNDEAFTDYSKPVGPFFSKEEADEMTVKSGYRMIDDAGRGYRRVVPSPKPLNILELDVIKALWDRYVTISCGGGGIPVVRETRGGGYDVYKGIGAVVDKDFMAALLAGRLDCDILIMATGVEKVSLNFNSPDEKPIDVMNVAEAEGYVEQGHFAKGSMLPKIEAAMAFVKGEYDEKADESEIRFARTNSGKEKFALITDLRNMTEALKGNTGTRIVK